MKSHKLGNLESRDRKEENEGCKEVNQ